MATYDKKYKVLRTDQSPMNPKRWCLELACGHEIWMTATKRPARKTAFCPICPDQRIKERT